MYITQIVFPRGDPAQDGWRFAATIPTALATVAPVQGVAAQSFQPPAPPRLTPYRSEATQEGWRSAVTLPLVPTGIAALQGLATEGFQARKMAPLEVRLPEAVQEGWRWGSTVPLVQQAAPALRTLAAQGDAVPGPRRIDVRLPEAGQEGWRFTATPAIVAVFLASVRPEAVRRLEVRQVTPPLDTWLSVATGPLAPLLALTLTDLALAPPRQPRGTEADQRGWQHTAVTPLVLALWPALATQQTWPGYVPGPRRLDVQVPWQPQAGWLTLVTAPTVLPVLVAVSSQAHLTGRAWAAVRTPRPDETTHTAWFLAPPPPLPLYAPVAQTSDGTDLLWRAVRVAVASELTLWTTVPAGRPLLAGVRNLIGSLRL